MRNCYNWQHIRLTVGTVLDIGSLRVCFKLNFTDNTIVDTIKEITSTLKLKQNLMAASN